MDAHSDLTRFSDTLHKIDRVYDLYAKSRGVSNSGLYLLHLVYCHSACTQTFLAEEMLLPKQTINSIVKSYETQGLLEMVMLPADHRQRGLKLTEQGLAYVRQYLPAILTAEQKSIEQFTCEERDMLLALLDRYVDTLYKELLQK